MRVIKTSVDEDLSLFCGYLWQKRVPHRVYEESGSQVLEVADPGHADPVREAYQAWKSGRLRIEAAPRVVQASRWPQALARYPGLTALIALTLAAFPFSYAWAQGSPSAVVAALMVLDPRLAVTGLPPLTELLAQGQVWRWFTPMLLHFSVLHLAFNCAITIELGRRVEGRLGAGGLWLVVLFLAGVSNLTQYAISATASFGGLSGVAYGLLGFVVIMSRLAPDVPEWRFHPGLAVALLVFLVLFSTGITEPFGLLIANTAHWAGLGAGVAAALVLGRRRPAHD